MAKVLRTEQMDWQGIRQAFADLLNADQNYLFEYEAELTRLGAELRAIEQLVTSGDLKRARDQYQALRLSIQTSRRKLSDQIALMQKAQTNVHSLLT
jgi:hypothetical protein